MGKSTFFTGQPIFNQLVNFLSKNEINKIARSYSADRYCKRFKTYDHLLVMLYTIFNRCSSIREVVTGLLASQSKLYHLGIDYSIRRSTLSDANQRRSHQVFESIYKSLYKRYSKFLPDSPGKRLQAKLFIADSTTISLFQEILKSAGRNPLNGKRKGGLKAHTLIKAQEDVPQLVCLTPGAASDTSFMKKITLPEGSILVFDRGYHDYKQLDRWTQERITWVTRTRKGMVMKKLYSKEVSAYQSKQGVISDTLICLGHDFHDQITKVEARLIVYFDRVTQRKFEFLTNNLEFSPLTIASLYKRRWQIEILFKRIKQNYPLRNFLGDNENAIKIQVWCALIADLILKVIHRHLQRHWSFSNLASMIRLHLMTYINLQRFLNHPEKALLKNARKIQMQYQKALFPT